MSYVFYWLAVIVVLIYMKFREVRFRALCSLTSVDIRHFQGRTKLLGRESNAGVRRRDVRAEKARLQDAQDKSDAEKSDSGKSDSGHQVETLAR